MTRASLLEPRPEGLYCPPAGFYIDPVRRVSQAILTHAHSDHARAGHGTYLCHSHSLPLLRERLGSRIRVQVLDYGIPLVHQGVRISLHPAGHIIGSAQIRLEYQGEVWVVSGDYKLEHDGITPGFEPVPCHTFLSECTFGLPIYQWEIQELVKHQMLAWIRKNQSLGRSPVLLAYSLGKAQRLIHMLGEEAGSILVHPAIAKVQQALADTGWNFAPVQELGCFPFPGPGTRHLVLLPPGGQGLNLLPDSVPVSLGQCSGWLRARNRRRGDGFQGSFVLSDHADWNGLQEAIALSRAEKIWLMHGFTGPFSTFLRQKGLDAHPLEQMAGSLP